MSPIEVQELPTSEPRELDDDSFPLLMSKLRTGDEEATRIVHERSVRKLIRLARTRLGRKVAGKEDAEDVVQSVYRTFFRRFGDGHFRFDGWADVWSLLATIARRKCETRRGRYETLRRDSSRELSLLGLEVPCRGPSVEEAAMVSETICRLMDGLKDEDRVIVQMSLEDYTVPEIARRVERSERTVHRVREYVRLQLTRWHAQEID